MNTNLLKGLRREEDNVLRFGSSRTVSCRLHLPSFVTEPWLDSKIFFAELKRRRNIPVCFEALFFYSDALKHRVRFRPAHTKG